MLINVPSFSFRSSLCEKWYSLSFVRCKVLFCISKVVIVFSFTDNTYVIFMIFRVGCVITTSMFLKVTSHIIMTHDLSCGVQRET